MDDGSDLGVSEQTRWSPMRDPGANHAAIRRYDRPESMKVKERCPGKSHHPPNGQHTIGVQEDYRTKTLSFRNHVEDDMHVQSQMGPLSERSRFGLLTQHLRQVAFSCTDYSQARLQADVVRRGRLEAHYHNSHSDQLRTRIDTDRKSLTPEPLLRMSNNVSPSGEPTAMAEDARVRQNWENAPSEGLQQLSMMANTFLIVLICVISATANNLAPSTSTVQDSHQIFRHRLLSLKLDSIMANRPMNDSFAINELCQAFSRWLPDNRAEGPRTHSEIKVHSRMHRKNPKIITFWKQITVLVDTNDCLFERGNTRNTRTVHPKIILSNSGFMKASLDDIQSTAIMVGESCELDCTMPRVSPSAAQADIPEQNDRGGHNEYDTAKAASILNDALSLAGMASLPCAPRYPSPSSSSTLNPSSVSSMGALTSPNINTQFSTLTPPPGFDHHQSSLILAGDFNISDDLRNSDNSVSLEELISVVGEDSLYELGIPGLTQQVQEVTRSRYNNATESLFPALVDLDTMHTSTSPTDSWDAFTPQSSVQSFNSPTTPQSEELFLDLGMNYQGSSQANDMPYFPPASRPAGSYIPMPPASSQQILNYQPNDAYSTNLNWMSLPLLSQSDSTYSAVPPNTVYPTFGTGYSSSSGQAPPSMTSSNPNVYRPTYASSNQANSRPQLSCLPHSNSQPAVPTVSSFHPSSAYLNRTGTPAYSQSSQSRSNTTSPTSTPQGDHPSSTIPSSSLDPISIPLPDGSRRCSYPGCTSRALFTRGCDLRKHYNRHQKHLYCRLDPSCPQSAQSCASRKDGGGGFSSNKDRARHEAKHNPRIQCEWRGTDEHGREVRCERMFSRVDNMKDHVRRIHMKGSGDRDKDVPKW